MEKSEKFGFNLPSGDADDIADISQISNNFRIIEEKIYSKNEEKDNLDKKQDLLKSGENIKTVNGESVLGKGNIEIEVPTIKIDQIYIPTSENAQSGKAVAEAVQRPKILDYITYEFVDKGSENGTITITACDTNIMGDFEIPSSIVVTQKISDGQGNSFFSTRLYPVTVIGDNAFYECSKLANLSIPNGVTTIGNRAFNSCYMLKNIAIPDSVTTIGDNAFGSCYALKNISLGNGVTTIGNGAFATYSELSNITIPASVTKIGDNAFGGNALTDVYYKGTKEQWETIEIGENNDWVNTATIHYNQELATEDYVNNNFANALKSTKTDKVIAISDISPIEHKLKVKLSGEIEDFSGVTVSRYSKNLFDGNIDLGLRLQNKVVTEAKPETYGYKIIKSKPNTNYTVSWYGNYFADEAIIRIGTFTEYPKIGDVANQVVYKDTSLANSFSFTTGDNDNYLFLYFIRYNKTEGIELQAEVGEKSTEYEPYIDPQETLANADGTVDGLTSVYPTTVLATDNNMVTIECEYNRDIVKAFEQLQQAIISLGGNV